MGQGEDEDADRHDPVAELLVAAAADDHLDALAGHLLEQLRDRQVNLAVGVHDPIEIGVGPRSVAVGIEETDLEGLPAAAIEAAAEAASRLRSASDRPATTGASGIAGGEIRLRSVRKVPRKIRQSLDSTKSLTSAIPVVPS